MFDDNLMHGEILTKIIDYALTLPEVQISWKDHICNKWFPRFLSKNFFIYSNKKSENTQMAVIYSHKYKIYFYIYNN